MKQSGWITTNVCRGVIMRNLLSRGHFNCCGCYEVLGAQGLLIVAALNGIIPHSSRS